MSIYFATESGAESRVSNSIVKPPCFKHICPYRRRKSRDRRERRHKRTSMSASPEMQFLTQLEAAIQLAKSVKATSHYNDLSDMDDDPRTMQAIVANRAAIVRASGADSPYAKQAQGIIDGPERHGVQAVKIGGVTEGLRADLQSGFLRSFEELIHGEVFGDFLEMADHLLGSGYKDAAAVIAGSALEVHLRQLCKKNGISVEVTSSSGIRPKKADQMNADLAGAGAYSKLDQKSVTSWLDLRNKAAHGNYSEYSKEQVGLLIASVRDFICRIPG